MPTRIVRRRYNHPKDSKDRGINTKGRIDKRLFFLTILLTFLGLIAIADASAPLAVKNYSDKFYFARQQLIWALCGFTLLFVVSKVHYSFWARIASPFFFASVVGLLLVFIPGLGVNVLGATRWLNLGPYSFQPSELIKLSMAIYLAKVYSKELPISAYFLPVLVVAGIVMLQPDPKASKICLI